MREEEKEWGVRGRESRRGREWGARDREWGVGDREWGVRIRESGV